MARCTQYRKWRSLRARLLPHGVWRALGSVPVQLQAKECISTWLTRAFAQATPILVVAQQECLMRQNISIRNVVVVGGPVLVICRVTDHTVRALQQERSM